MSEIISALTEAGNIIALIALFMFLAWATVQVAKLIAKTIAAIIEALDNNTAAMKTLVERQDTRFDRLDQNVDNLLSIAKQTDKHVALIVQSMERDQQQIAKSG